VSDLLSLALTPSRHRATLTPTWSRLALQNERLDARLTRSRERLELTPSDLRLLAWRDSWDVTGLGGYDETYWSDGGAVGGIALRDGTTPGAPVWLTGWLTSLADQGSGSSFVLTFGEIDTVEGLGGVLTTARRPVDSSSFVITAHLLTTQAVPIAPLTLTAPVAADYYRERELVMPSRASVGIPASGWAVVQLVVRPVLVDAEKQRAHWATGTAAQWEATRGYLDADGNPSPGGDSADAYLAWLAQLATETAFNAAGHSMNLFFLLAAPSSGSFPFTFPWTL
jgi:hypothetical protein